MPAEIKFTNYFKKTLLDGNYDFGNDTIKAMLLTSSHTTNVDTQQFADDISANEVSTSGSYTSGFGNRVSLTVSTSQDDTDDEGVVDVTDWNVTTFTADVAYVAFIKEVTADSDSPILAIEDLNGNVSAVGGTWSYTTNSEGLVNAS